jgi:hypothetical protein
MDVVITILFLAYVIGSLWLIAWQRAEIKAFRQAWAEMRSYADGVYEFAEFADDIEKRYLHENDN